MLLYYSAFFLRFRFPASDYRYALLVKQTQTDLSFLIHRCNLIDGTTTAYVPGGGTVEAAGPRGHNWGGSGRTLGK